MLKTLGNNINMLNKALDGLWLRDKVINHNIANVNTPNYKRMTVNFEDKLRQAIAGHKRLMLTNDRHISITKSADQLKPEIATDRNHSYRFDRNNVNIDVESAELAKNTIMYNAVINQIIGEFDKLKNVINEGSK